MHNAVASRRAGAGWTLIVLGVIGVLTGVIPLAINTCRVLAGSDAWGTVDLAAHGVEAMGLSVEWAMLSSALGAYLGVLLLWAGAGWLKGRAWAPLVSWTYVLAGLTVNVTDMLIFAFRARPGPMRSRMLVFDGIALLIPVVVAAWLIGRAKAAGRVGPAAPTDPPASQPPDA
jgi:hypothetical protein